VLKRVGGKHGILSEEKLGVLFQLSRQKLVYWKAWIPWRHIKLGGFRSKLCWFDHNIGLCRRWATVNLLWWSQCYCHFLFNVSENLVKSDHSNCSHQAQLTASQHLQVHKENALTGSDVCCQRYFRARRPNRAVPFDALFLAALFTLQNGARLQASTSLSTYFFCESILFVHLKALRGGELRLMRTVGMVRLDEILFETLSQKLALTLRPPPQIYCSPSSAQSNVIIKPV